MDLKNNAAGRKPAATSKNTNTFQNSKTHHTTVFTPLNVERLLSQIELAKLAEQAGTELHQSGRELRGVCPLHKGDNRTAFSIYIDEDGRERWHCYTDCNTGGDAIDFVRRWRGMDFIEAVKHLAEYAGLGLDELGLSPQNVQAESERRKRTDLFGAAARYFASRLWDKEGEVARAWLLKRGFTEKTLRSAGWGFCKTDNGLLQHLQKAGADLTLARQSGLLRADGLDFTANAEGQAAAPDGYVIYPHTWNGQVVYFSARGLNPVNPDDKSRNLPGERQVYWALVPGDTKLVIVEGQSDAESLRQIGRSALGLCGLGSIPTHEIERIQRYRAVYLALDNDLLHAKLPAIEQDKIRKRKAESTARLCESLGPLTMVAKDLPAKDINAWLQKGLTADLLEKHLASAQTWLDMLIEQARCAPPLELDSRLQVIAAHLGGLSETLQSRYFNAIERKFDLGRRDIKRLMQQNEPGADLLYSEIKEGRLHFMGEPLGNFWARISHELIVDDGLNPPTVRYSVDGGLAGSQLLQSVQVEARSFSKLDWIPDNWGMRPIIYLPPGKSYLIARAIQEVSQKNAQRERLYTFTGWTENEGRRGFLSACGWLSADGLNDQIRVDLGANNLRHYALPQPKANADAAVRASLDFLALGPRKVTAPIWAAMYAAPLTSLRPLNAVISVYGTTQSGKSTITHLALTHFGSGFIQGRDYHAPVDWTSTVTAIEAAMFLAKDVPLVIDDFAPQFSSLAEARTMHKKAHYVVRSVGNRSARGRSRADLSQQATRFPRGLVLMTAENPLVGQSIVGRMIYVGVEPGDILPAQGVQAQDDRLTTLQEKAQQGLLAQAMSLYVQYLAEHWERIAESFPAMVDAASQVARQAGGLQNRLPDSYGVLSAAQEVALRCFQDLGLVSPAEAGKLAEENNAALLEIIRSQAEQVAAESPVRKFFTALTALLEQRKVYLAPRTQVVEYRPPVNAELVGYFEPDDGQVVYLRTEACLARAKEFWRGLDENLDIMPDALRRQLSQVPGVLIRVGERQVEVTKFCAGANQRILELDSGIVEQLYGVSLVNPEK
jgi:hypothetical protein